MRKIIFCPICKKRGINKRLLDCSSDTGGTLYCWCKSCKQEIKITVRADEP